MELSSSSEDIFTRRDAIREVTEPKFLIIGDLSSSSSSEVLASLMSEYQRKKAVGSGKKKRGRSTSPSLSNHTVAELEESSSSNSLELVAVQPKKKTKTQMVMDNVDRLLRGEDADDDDDGDDDDAAAESAEDLSEETRARFEAADRTAAKMQLQLRSINKATQSLRTSTQMAFDDDDDDDDVVITNAIEVEVSGYIKPNLSEPDPPTVEVKLALREPFSKVIEKLKGYMFPEISAERRAELYQISSDFTWTLLDEESTPAEINLEDGSKLGIAVAEEEEKIAEVEVEEKVHFYVRPFGVDEDKISLKMSVTDTFEKMFVAIAEKVNRPLAELTFEEDGLPLQPTDTPRSRDFFDDLIVEVKLKSK